MNTDLDTRLTNALTDAANTTYVSDDALARITRRASLHDGPPRRRRMLIASVTALGVAAGASATYAVVQERLSTEQAQIVEQCGLAAEAARLVASAEGYGRTVDYWVADEADQYGDFLITRGGTGGGGSCGEQTRQQARPTLPWANYLLDPGNGTALFWLYGQAPTDAVSVQIVMSTGTVQTAVGTDGYFVALAELPYAADDRLERVDALAADGQVIASGGLS